MPITSKDLGKDLANRPRTRNIASLVGGWVIAAGCFVLMILVAAQLTGGVPAWPLIAAALAISAGIGLWIRLADL